MQLGDVAIFSADLFCGWGKWYESKDECGVVYNSIDGKGTLFNSKEIISGRKDADTIGVNLDICDQRILPETTVQRVTIVVEDEHHQKERKNHPLCIYHGDINTPEYLGRWHWTYTGIRWYCQTEVQLAGQERNQLMMPSLLAYGVSGRNLAIRCSVNDTRIGKNWGSRSKHIYIKFAAVAHRKNLKLVIYKRQYG